MSSGMHCALCNEEIDALDNDTVPTLYDTTKGVEDMIPVCPDCHETKLNGGQATGNCIECGEKNVKWAYGTMTGTITPETTDVSDSNPKGGILCEDDYNSLRE